MDNKVLETKQYLLSAFVQYGVDNEMLGIKKICQKMNVGIMTAPEFFDEMIMELIRYAYDKNAPKESIRSHLIRNGMESDDSKKAAYGRIREYAQKYRNRELRARTHITQEAIDGLTALPMDSIEDKLSGYKYNKMQFFELTQMQEIRIMKSFVEHRLEDTNKVNNTKFKLLFEEYDTFIDSLRITDEMSDEDVVFNSIAYWVIQWKYPFELLYAIAVYEEEHKGSCENIRNLALLCCDVSIIRPTGKVSTHSRFIKVRNDMVPRLLCNDESMCEDVGFDSYTMEEYLYLKSIMMKSYCVNVDKMIYLRDWFAEETTMKDWADFLREYNVFDIHQNKEWTNKRIRTVRELIKKLTIK